MLVVLDNWKAEMPAVNKIDLQVFLFRKKGQRCWIFGKQNRQMDEWLDRFVEFNKILFNCCICLCAMFMSIYGGILLFWIYFEFKSLYCCLHTTHPIHLFDQRHINMQFLRFLWIWFCMTEKNRKLTHSSIHYIF